MLSGWEGKEGYYESQVFPSEPCVIIMVVIISLICSVVLVFVVLLVY